MDCDPELAELDGQGLGESLEASLRSGTVCPAAVAQRGDAGKVDDPAPFGFGHVLLGGLAHQERASQVHAHDGIPVVAGHLEQQEVAGDAGVVHQHRGVTELPGDPFHGGRTACSSATATAGASPPDALISSMTPLHEVSSKSRQRRRSQPCSTDWRWLLRCPTQPLCPEPWIPNPELPMVRSFTWSLGGL